jgi:hypothetical protein
MDFVDIFNKLNSKFIFLAKKKYLKKFSNLDRFWTMVNFTSTISSILKITPWCKIFFCLRGPWSQKWQFTVLLLLLLFYNFKSQFDNYTNFEINVENLKKKKFLCYTNKA